MVKQKRTEFVRWMGPLLDVLRELGGSASPREASDAIAEKLHLNAETRNALTKTGQERFHNQVQWARQYLVWEGYIDAGRRGVWALTPNGWKTSIDVEEGHRIFLKWVAHHSARRKSKEDPIEQVASQISDETPPEIGIAQNLLDVLRGLSPSGFERICQRLLREAGFDKVEVTGRSGDGGIDGIGVLQINPLVSFRVVFQCKKWSGSGSIPPKEIRDLRGAMDGRAEKGIFIATGTFSAQARAEAECPGATPIELVDGDKLIGMFESLELGVRPKTVFEIDYPFFESFKN